MNTEILDKIQLRQGGGAGDPKQGLCVMELVSWLAGANDTTDHPESASPLLTRFGIALNDTAPSARTRNSLRALAPLLAGSRSDAHESARAAYILREIAHKVAAPALRADGAKTVARALSRAQSRAEIAFIASVGVGGEHAHGLGAQMLAALEEAASDEGRTGLAEQVLLRLETCAFSEAERRRRLVLWRAMRDILEGALRLGPHGLAADAVETRLEALAVLLWPRRERPQAAPAAALPGWLDALVNGPAGEPQLAAPPKAKGKTLEPA